MENTIHIDALLWNKVAAGDEGAFKIIFESYWPQVYGTSLRLTRAPEQARDLAQDIFIRLWEKRDKLSSLQNPDSYIYILSRNLVMDHLRKKVFDPSHIDYVIRYFTNDVASPQEKLEFRELELTLNAAVEALPTKLKEVFVCSRVEGLTHEQIAAKLGISVVSSKTYIVRALQHIRDYMADHADDTVCLMIAAILPGLQ